MSELKTSLSIDTAEDKFVLRHEQDVSSILEANKAAQADAVGKRWNDFERVASIPFAVVLEWKEKYGINVLAPSEEDKARMVALLNDPDYAYLRTRGGRL